jgi:hypothetical protein
MSVKFLANGEFLLESSGLAIKYEYLTKIKDINA